MNKKLFLFICILGLARLAAAQQVLQRVIFLGNTADLQRRPQDAVSAAAKQVLRGKTTVMFLGDNTAGNGMALPGSPAAEAAGDLLRSQFAPMRLAGASVYFLPGNREWGNSAPGGLAHLLSEQAFLAAQQDSLLQLVPAEGCPDPVAIRLPGELTIIAFDSEYWLSPYFKKNPDAECDCCNKADVLDRLKQLLDENSGRVILFASHHPFQQHGGKGGFIFLTPENSNHPVYRDMVRKVTGVFSAYPNLTWVGAHTGGMQLLQREKTGLQVIAGGGEQKPSGKKGKHVLYQQASGGFVLADLLDDRSVRFTFYTCAGGVPKQEYSYTRPYVPVSPVLSRKLQPLLQDSVSIKVYPAYDSVSRVHRLFFGENYRKEYGLDVRVPVFRLSEMKGGLKPLKRGGGLQSHSLRLEDRDGKEWVLRSVEKYPEALVPEPFRETFVLDVLKDNMSAQHPFSALVVPDLAEAIGVYHASPQIGWVSPDENLGPFGQVFGNTLCLLEAREPEGKSDNTPKMFRKLVADNDNSYDGPMMLRAKALDVITGDWDRHADQWRWKPQKEGKKIIYQPVPRDRDQVFYLTQGILPRYAQSSYLLPYIQGFERNVQNINWYVWESRGIDSRLLSQLDEQQWTAVIQEVCSKLTDEVLEKALRRLPDPMYRLRHDQLLAQLQERRAKLPEMMLQYYRFLNRVVDIQGSNKGELVEISSTPEKALKVRMRQLSKHGELKAETFSKTFDPALTREIRVYLHGGNDSLVLNNTSSPVNIRIIGGPGGKAYRVDSAIRRVKLYDKPDSGRYTGQTGRLRRILSNDTANLAYRQTELYHRRMILPDAGYNADDGLLLGLSVKLFNPGFRKMPWSNTQQFAFLYAVNTGAFKFTYHGEWMERAGRADLLLDARAYLPNNTSNFFGLGNETDYDRSAKGIRYYRSRFSLFQLDPALRWKSNRLTFSAGPSFQYYSFSKKENEGRLVSLPGALGSADSLTVTKDKLYTGAVLQLVNDTRDHAVLPSLGSYLALKLQGYTGLNRYSNAFGQFSGSAAWYKNLDARRNFVLAERFGGTVTAGRQAFYQSAFLGGEGNLLGFRQYRFAGDYSFYNNLELRVKLADFMSYIFPGQLGMIGFYDVGRVWKRNERSDRWHTGTGAGFYVAPAGMAVLRVVAGHSQEGWYPYVSLSFRY